MTYKDIILNLLKKRNDVICLEKHLTDEFPGEKEKNPDLEKWLNENQIKAVRVQDNGPAKLVLKKEECCFS